MYKNVLYCKFILAPPGPPPIKPWVRPWVVTIRASRTNALWSSCAQDSEGACWRSRGGTATRKICLMPTSYSSGSGNSTPPVRAQVLSHALTYSFVRKTKPYKSRAFGPEFAGWYTKPSCIVYPVPCIVYF